MQISVAGMNRKRRQLHDELPPPPEFSVPSVQGDHEEDGKAKPLRVGPAGIFPGFAVRKPILEGNDILLDVSELFAVIFSARAHYVISNDY